MKIGTYYYPEQWPREQWERDFDSIERMGLQIVHMGEFAWFQMEPAEGKINLDWLAECVEMAAKRDLKVILCTPTAAPPIWLTETNPEILPSDHLGRPGRFGGRRHYNPLAPAMVLAAKRIVTRFGRPLRTASGRHWLADRQRVRRRFRSIRTDLAGLPELARGKVRECGRAEPRLGAINSGTRTTPTSRRSACPTAETRSMPTRTTDWTRRGSGHGHLRSSTRYRRTYSKPRIGNRFITTNLMPLHPDVSPDDLAKDLSLYSWDLYPVGFVKPTGDQTFRMADPAMMSLVHDQMASYCGRWALMELQPGQVNWGSAPVLLYPGAIRLWIWTAFAHRAEFVTTYRFRQPRFGVEMFHHGLVGTDGTTLTAGGREFQQTISEVRRLDPTKLETHPLAAPPQTTRARKKAAVQARQPAGPTIGLYLDFQQIWYYQTLPQARRWNYGALLSNLYGAILRLGVNARVIRPGEVIPQEVKLLVIPGVQMVNDEMVGAWRNYVAAGGNLLITCRTGLMDGTGQFIEGPAAKPIMDLIGGSIDAYDGLPEGMSARVEMDDVEYDWGVWGDLLYPEETTRVLATYHDQFYAGAAAILQKRHGDSSTVTYCGVFPEEPLADALLEKLARQIEIPVNPTPRRVNIVRHGGYWICLNFQDQPYELNVPEETRFVVGSRTVDAADVAVWEEPVAAPKVR